MRMQEDNYMASQLNSLDSLPDGYQVNISSKWEMIEMGMEQKKKRFPFYWMMAAAACLVLIAGIGYFSMNDKKATVLVIDSPKKQGPGVQKQLPLSNGKAQPQMDMAKAERKQVPVPSQKTTVVEPTLSINTIDSTFTKQATAKLEPILQEKPVEANTATDSIAIAVSPIIKKNKPRYFQMDFGEGTPNDAVQKTASNKILQFKFSSKAQGDGLLSPTKTGLPKLVQPL